MQQPTTSYTGPADLLDGLQSLVSFPDIAYRIEELLDDPNAGAREFGRLIESEVALSALLLRISNSALYAPASPVDSVERAIAIVGLRAVRDLAYGMCARHAFEGIPNELVSVSDFWRHSLYCAAAAQAVADHAGVCRGQSTFTMGMLHDVGQLVMFHQAPELSRQALELSIDRFDGEHMNLAEAEIFGFDHTEVGAELARSWNLPPVIQACLQFHHNPLAGPAEHLDAVKVVHAANSIAVLAEFEITDASELTNVEPSVLSKFRIDDEFLAQVVPQARAAAGELLPLIVG